MHLLYAQCRVFVGVGARQVDQAQSSHGSRRDEMDGPGETALRARWSPMQGMELQTAEGAYCVPRL
jgi:hypothetical protein